jgi:urease accessory protein
MNTCSLLQGFRFIDTFFPSGGFAYSSGLETAVQEGNVQTSEDLNHYVVDYLWWGMGKCEAVALAQAHHASTIGNLDGVIKTDTTLESMKLCRETRVASRQMGRSLVKNTAPPHDTQGILAAFQEAIDAGHSPGHLAVVLGVMFQGIGWSRQQAIAGFLYQAGVGFVSASYKLFPIGQREGQRLLEKWTPLMVELSQTIDVHTPMMSWAPIQEIYAMRHSQLTTRMFRS